MKVVGEAGRSHHANDFHVSFYDRVVINVDS